MTNLEKAEYITSEAQKRGINLCNDFDNWTRVCMALADLGEPARPLFHALASMDKAYKENESDRKFTNCLQTTRNIHFATLIYLAELNGIRIPKDLNGYKPTFKTLPQSKPATPASQPEPPTYISDEELRETYKFIPKSALIRFCCKLFPAEKVCEVWRMYFVGCSDFKHGFVGDYYATTFPYIDMECKIIDYKIMHYNPNTGSSKYKQNGKECRYPVSCGFAYLGKTGRRAEYCNFGDHLLIEPSNNDRIIRIVESEKSALILAMAFPNYVWIAVGGISKLNKNRLAQYGDRPIELVCDRDGVDKWQAKCDELEKAGCNVTLNDIINDYPGGEKDDLADVIIRSRLGTQQPAKPAEPAEAHPNLSPRQRKDLDLTEWYAKTYRSAEILIERLHLHPTSMNP